ncbi:MAG TPA: hypothetical protein VFT98_13675 [Myxococcota bacterium]|nr:hypothetical protein [Myxococcota bacterium]
MKIQLPLLASLALIACGDPVGPFSGGALSGETKPSPASWDFAAKVEQVQLETDPDQPHSVNTWIGVVNGVAYIPSSMIRGPKLPSEREWVRNVSADDRVRVRIDGAIYELRAVRVADSSAEHRAALDELVKKYELVADDLDPDRAIWIYRLQVR